MKSTITILILFFTGVLFSQEVPEKYDQIWDKVNNSFGDETVKTELATLCKNNPNDPWIYWISGINCNPITETEESIFFFQKAIEVDSTFPHAYFNLAQELENETAPQIETKIKLLTKGIQLGCLDYAFLVRGEMYLLQGKYELALADSEAAFNGDIGDQIDAIALLVQILDAQGNTETLHQILSEVDFSEGMFGTDFAVFLAEKYLEMDDLEPACYWFGIASEFYIESENEIPDTILNGLDTCK